MAAARNLVIAGMLFSATFLTLLSALHYAADRSASSMEMQTIQPAQPAGNSSNGAAVRQRLDAAHEALMRQGDRE